MAPLRTPVNLPEVTDAHRAAAFARFAWTDLTYEQAMADPLRGRLIEARAHQLRTQEWKQGQRRPSARLYTLPRIASRPVFDAKRAAAGDFDE